MNYQEPFILRGKRGNNAFSYEKRGGAPQLFVPSVIDGTFEDLRLGKQVVFEDEDEHGVLRSCAGLEHFVKMEWACVPTVVFDNHNHAFYFWYEALRQGVLRRGATLIHVDQHKDMREPAEPFDGKDVFAYTNEVLNVGNYIVPARDEGLLGDILLVTGESDLEQWDFIGEGNKILNIDLDYFAPELSYIDFEKARAFILAHLKEASLVTIATSPFFIDQDLALERLGNLINLVKVV